MTFPIFELFTVILICTKLTVVFFKVKFFDFKIKVSPCYFNFESFYPELIIHLFG